MVPLPGITLVIHLQYRQPHHLQSEPDKCFSKNIVLFGVGNRTTPLGLDQVEPQTPLGSITGECLNSSDGQGLLSPFTASVPVDH